MNAPRTFKSLSSSLDLKKIAAVVGEVAKEGNVPSMTYPDDPAPPAPEVAPPVALAPVPSADAQEKIAHLRKAKPVRKANPAPLNRVAVDLPDYLVDAISAKAAKERVTKRFLYLKAFEAAGYDIRDADMMEDGRRES